jgi:hypothetical protein
MNTSKPGLRGALSASAALVVMTMLLGACTSNGTTADTERAAAAPISDVESSDVESSDVESSDVESSDVESSDVESSDVEVDAAPTEGVVASEADSASVKGTRVCVTNDTDDSPDPYFRDREPTLNWLDEDSKTGSGKLPIGSTFCAEGTGVRPGDVGFVLSDFALKKNKIVVALNNPWIGYPTVNVDENPLARCINQGFSIGEKVEVHFVIPMFYMIVERKSDTRWKEFQFTLKHDTRNHIVDRDRCGEADY